MMGTRKLRVLPVPVEAVARTSAPSSAGGMACACTGVGVMKPACVRRDFKESEMLNALKRIELDASVELGWIVDTAWIVSGWSSIAVVKMFPLGEVV